MRSLSARGADVTPAALSLGYALEALAPEIDPELCRELATAGVAVHQIFVPSMFDWSPLAVALRLDERKQKLLAELLSRARSRTRELVWLPDDPTLGARPFAADELAELVPEDIDPEKSEVILGGHRYRVRVLTERRAEPRAEPQNPDEAPAPPEDRPAQELFWPSRDEFLRAAHDAGVRLGVDGMGGSRLEHQAKMACGEDTRGFDRKTLLRRAKALGLLI